MFTLVIFIYTQTDWLSANTPSCTDGALLKNILEYTLSHLDDILLPSSVGSLSESYVPPPSDLLIQGKCREITFLKSQYRSCDSTSPSLRFVCVHRLSGNPPTSDSSDGKVVEEEQESVNSSSPRVPILSIKSTSELCDVAALSVGMNAAVQALHLLREASDRVGGTGGFLVVFCNETVDDTIQFIANKLQIVIVSKSP